MSRRIVLAGILILEILLVSACGASGGVDPEDARDRDRDHDVRENMRRAQYAAEHWAGGHGGSTYPLQIDDEFKSYLPGGQEGRLPSPVGPVNPFTGVNEFPEIGSLPDVQSMRHGARFAVGRGKIIYSPMCRGRAYAIVGGAHDGKVLMDAVNPGEVLVFTNLQ